MKSFQQQQENQELRSISLKSAELNNHQKSVFKKLLQSGIEIDCQNPSIMKMITMGVPSPYRATFWPMLMQNSHGITLDFYHSLINKAAIHIGAEQKDVCAERERTIKHLKSIEQDIERTYPDLKVFKKQTDQGQSLFNILSAWTVFREDIGYLQGMSQIAGLLLLELDQFTSFKLFCSILTTDVLFWFEGMEMEEVNKFEACFQNRLKRGDSQFYYKLKEQKIECRKFLLPWILTLFTRLMSIDMVSQLWDILLLYELNISILVEVCFQTFSVIKESVDFSQLDENELIQTLKSYKCSSAEAYSILSQVRPNFH